MYGKFWKFNIVFKIFNSPLYRSISLPDGLRIFDEKQIKKINRKGNLRIFSYFTLEKNYIGKTIEI